MLYMYYIVRILSSYLHSKKNKKLKIHTLYSFLLAIYWRISLKY